MARAAGLAMSKIMGVELVPHSILVNALCVGPVLSEQWKRFHANDRPEASFDEYMAGGQTLFRWVASVAARNLPMWLASWRWTLLRM